MDDHDEKGGHGLHTNDSSDSSNRTFLSDVLFEYHQVLSISVETYFMKGVVWPIYAARIARAVSVRDVDSGRRSCDRRGSGRM